MPKNKVLIPIDEIEFTLQIVPYIFRYLVPEENELILLYMVEQHTHRSSKQPYTQAAVLDEGQTDTAVQASFRHEVQPYIHALQRAGFTVSTQVAFGEPRHAIAQSIQREAINLVVMATAPQLTATRMFSAGAAQQVMQQVTVPVMLYHKVAVGLDSPVDALLH